jgi:hypothetical protein
MKSIKKLKRKKKKNMPKVVWKQAKNVSAEEAQRRLNAAFDILFNAVLENKKLGTSSKAGQNLL